MRSPAARRCAAAGSAPTVGVAGFEALPKPLPPAYAEKATQMRR
ncbi:hypothetical protein [Sphingomonas sp. TDK1]|nr:hypothetical protein [Sphingomonas sp. TDK1]